MAVMTFQEVDEMLYEFVGGATDATKGFKATKFDDCALYIGEHTPYKSEASRRHLPCIVIEQTFERPSYNRLTSVTEHVVSSSDTEEVVNEGPIPYDVFYNVHFFSKKKADHRNLRTLWAGTVPVFGTMGEGDSYYELLGSHKMMDEHYGDQVVYHDVYELVIHIEVANLNTATYKRVTEAVVSFDDDRTLTVTEESIEV